jgi:hypothetical protein
MKKLLLGLGLFLLSTVQANAACILPGSSPQSSDFYFDALVPITVIRGFNLGPPPTFVERLVRQVCATVTPEPQVGQIVNFGAGYNVRTREDIFGTAIYLGNGDYRGRTLSYEFSNLLEFRSGSISEPFVFRQIFPSVPEPATWATLLIGFALTGASMRYRLVYSDRRVSRTRGFTPIV